jgi:hypothetical protein
MGIGTIPSGIEEGRYGPQVYRLDTDVVSGELKRKD